MKRKGALLAILLSGVMLVGGYAAGCKKKSACEHVDVNPQDYVCDKCGADLSGSATGLAESVVFNTNTINLNMGGKATLNATVLPETATNKNLTWASSNIAVATVSGGVITAVAPGTANITATTSNGKVATCAVTVTDTEASILYSAANFESAAFEWDETNAQNATVEYKLSSASAYTRVDSELIRQTDDPTVARVDVLGLKGGESYDFKITTSTHETLYADSVKVKSYDRSGYAHFNYTDGVGAYKDDGTLKDDAIVIYVTDQNKDTVMTEVAQKYDAVNMFNIPYCSTSSVPNGNWNGKSAAGIGWWLNCAQYTMNNANSGSNKTPSNTYDATNGSHLGFRGVEVPIVIRFIGKVTTPEGCTRYNCEGEGGSIGDGGHMARMKNCANVTIEGVGEDAMLYGWGIHFMGGTDATGDQGKNFEVRNLTFFEYPEDAIGMEGVQGGNTITGPVEHCWVHHNTFLPGHYSTADGGPAESDKKEGDGSCDFKRGQFLTVSYNWYEYCHKTNLVGSSDSSLQYNLSFHHNVWYKCSSRIPLARQANIHFYNNYVWADDANMTSPYNWAEGKSSYVHSLRADSYIFAEANFYEGCKNVTDGKSGGACKGWGNIYYACFGSNTIVNATDREQVVANGCQYLSFDYRTFDTDPTKFYYDAETKSTKGYVTDAVTARKDCLTYAGVLKHSYEGYATDMTDERASAALSIPSGSTGLTIDLSKASLGGEVTGVKFVGAKNVSGNAKGRGILAVFTLAESAQIKLSSTASADQYAELYKVDGTAIATNITTYIGELEAGNYMIISGMKDKDCTITELSFISGTSDSERVENVISLISAIGTVEYTPECKVKIDAAQSAYNALSAELKATVTNAADLTAAVNSYNSFAASSVIDLINAIGTVDVSSGAKINAARTAYSKLTAAQQQLVTNINTLTAAEAAFEQFEVLSIKNTIAALAEPSSVSAEEDIRALYEQYLTVRNSYDGLTDEKKAQIDNYSKVETGIATLAEALKPYDVIDMIEALPDAEDVTASHGTQITAANNAYNALNQNQKAVISQTLKDKLDSVNEAYQSVLQSVTVYIFTANDTDLANGTVSGSSIGYKDTSFSYNGKNYTRPLKTNSKVTVTLTLASKSTVVLCVGGAVTVDGTAQTPTSGLITLTLEAGTHVINKGNCSESWLGYITVTPVA